MSVSDFRRRNQTCWNVGKDGRFAGYHVERDDVMIQSLIAVQTSAPVASVQQNHEGQSVLQSHNANNKVQEEQRQLRESVVKKDEAVFYEQHHDAREEGRNKYSNLYGKKKKKKDEPAQEVQELGVNRVNFDMKI